MKVLLIEDNETLGSFLQDILVLKKYHVEWLKDGLDIPLYFLQSDYDIVLLDWMLPSTTGIDVIKALRNQDIHVPIIMLTAKSDINDKVEGLTSGADDYLTKPFNVDELEARMIAVLKRYQSITHNQKKIGNVVFDLVKHRFTVNDMDLVLTRKEYLLLELLFLNHTVSRTMMLDKIWASEQLVGDNNIDALVKLLKKKLSTQCANVKIKAIRSVGYVLEVDHEDVSI